MLRRKAEIMRKPEWLKLKIQGDKNTTDVESMIEGLNLHTVCHEANCPNKMECYFHDSWKELYKKLYFL